jgi:hypothetical protein
MHRSAFGLSTLVAAALALTACGGNSTEPEDFGPMTLVAADSDGHIYIVNENTGVETIFRQTSMSNGTGGSMDIGVVSSMEWVPSTSKWWLGTGGTASCDACILTLDAATGVATLLRQATELYAIPGLAVHPSTGKIYTFEADGSCCLYEITAASGAVTELMDTLTAGSSGKGTTFTSDGTLYVAGSNRLGRIDVNARTHQFIANLSYVGFPAFSGSQQPIGELATRSDGVVFAIVKDGGGNNSTSTTYLARVNLTTAVVTNIGANTNNLDGLAYVPTSLVD